MLSTVLALFVRLMAINAEVECRIDPIDYDVAECDGMAEHLVRLPHTEWIGSTVDAIPASEECAQY